MLSLQLWQTIGGEMEIPDASRPRADTQEVLKSRVLCLARRYFRRLLSAIILFLLVPAAPAQLAITEVMSHATVHLNPDVRRPDFWELTNFGTNDVELEGYFFSDRRRTTRLYDEPFRELILGPGETVIFFRLEAENVITNAAQFRAWWGEGNLPADLKIRTYADPGLDGDFRDELWLYDYETNVIDGVQYGDAREGRTFRYDVDNGNFGVITTPGVSGAFKAAQSEDYGTPGRHEGASSLRIVQHPADQHIDAGAEATFSVIGAGLPRPKYQWMFKSPSAPSPVELPGAVNATLVLSNVQPDQAGYYFARLYNALAEQTTLEALLTVNTNPAAPTILSAPLDLSVFPGQTASFRVLARGYPAPQYQWQINGQDVPSATNAVIETSSIIAEQSGDRYSVRIWNDQGGAGASAVLTVTRRPMLKFTEVMPSAVRSDSSGHYDWFEITNYDTNTVNLQGYRFFDTPSLAGAVTITDPLFIRPGESIVFVEAMSASQFAAWWGWENLPSNAQLYTFHGFSLRDVGETLYFWNPAAKEGYEYLVTAGWGTCTTGISLECVSDCSLLEDYGCVADCLTDSIAGINGAYLRGETSDTASPFYVTNPPPRVVDIASSGAGMRIRARGTTGERYRLVASSNLTSWSSSQAAVTATNIFFYLEDPTPRTASQRFYRIVEEAR